MSENKNSQESPEKGPDSSPKCNFEGLDMEIMSPRPRIEQPLHRNLKSSTRVKASLSIQEQIALFHKDLFGSDEDDFNSGSSGGFDGETVKEEARKESVPIISSPSRKN